MMLKYNEYGELTYVELRDIIAMTEEQRDWIWRFIPKTLLEIQGISNKMVKVTEIQSDLSFAAFWELYDYKLGNKERAKQHWNKLDDATRQVVMQKVLEYNYYMAQQTHAKVFAERFLSQKRWENDFKNIK